MTVIYCVTMDEATIMTILSKIIVKRQSVLDHSIVHFQYGINIFKVSSYMGKQDVVSLTWLE